MFALVVDAVLASRRELLEGLKEHGGGRGVCSLLGYDFMISRSGRPFLIEVNNNPLITAQNPWHDMLLHRMVDDYVTLAADCPFFEGTPPPQPRPPLDGKHCKDFEGNGFVLLAGRPQDSCAAPMFALNNVGNLIVLQRDPMERRRAAAVDEPAPPGLPPAVCSPPHPAVSPERGFRTRRQASPRARSHSPRPRTDRLKAGGKGSKAEKKKVLSEEEQIAIARAALYGGGMKIS